jgi:hypothetical protein
LKPKEGPLVFDAMIFRYDSAIRSSSAQKQSLGRNWFVKREYRWTGAQKSLLSLQRHPLRALCSVGAGKTSTVAHPGEAGSMIFAIDVSPSNKTPAPQSGLLVQLSWRSQCMELSRPCAFREDSVIPSIPQHSAPDRRPRVPQQRCASRGGRWQLASVNFGIFIQLASSADFGSPGRNATSSFQFHLIVR